MRVPPSLVITILFFLLSTHVQAECMTSFACEECDVLKPTLCRRCKTGWNMRGDKLCDNCSRFCKETCKDYTGCGECQVGYEQEGGVFKKCRTKEDPSLCKVDGCEICEGGNPMKCQQCKENYASCKHYYGAECGQLLAQIVNRFSFYSHYSF